MSPSTKHHNLGVCLKPWLARLGCAGCAHTFRPATCEITSPDSCHHARRVRRAARGHGRDGHAAALPHLLLRVVDE